MDDTFRFNCPRCRYKTNDRGNYIKHLTKKTPCMPYYSEQSIEEIKASLNPEKEFKCNHCNKSFTQQSNLSRHRRIHDEEQATPIVALTNNDNSTTNTTTNEHSNNTTNHIDSHNTTNITDSHDNITNNINIENLTVQILPFGREDTSHVVNNEELLNDCLKNIAAGIPSIIEAIYFNDDKPENQNVKLGRNTGKDPPPEMMVYKADANGIPSWQAAERSGVLKNLVDTGARILITFENKIYCLQKQEDQTDHERNEANELHDDKIVRLSNITTKKKGKYVPVRDAVLLKAKHHHRKKMNL